MISKLKRKLSLLEVNRFISITQSLKQNKQELSKSDQTSFNRDRSHVRRLIDLKGYMDLIIYLSLGGAAYYVYKRNKKEEKELSSIDFKEIDDKYQKYFKSNLITINNGQYTLPKDFLKKLNSYKEFKLREDDVWVATFPKSGTTWVQEIVYLIVNNCDFDKAREKNIDERFPFLEFGFPSAQNINQLKSPRLIKTHLPLDLLPNEADKTCKIIYVLRNPKDVCVSYFNFCKNVSHMAFDGSFDEFVELFLSGCVPYGPYWNHVSSYLSHSHNIHVVYYEDLHEKPVEIIKGICKFLNRDLNDEQIHKIIDWCSFTNMKQNKRVNYEWYKEYGLFSKEMQFYRKGKIGDWLNYFNGNASIVFDKIMRAKIDEKYESKFNYGLTREDIAKIHEEYLKNLK